MVTGAAKLAQWKGHPVPWVARWTHEINNDRATISMTPEGVMLHYTEGRENREASGILWKREGLSRGGEPEFGEVNVYRQRACMTKRKCQVCGGLISAGVIRWLMHPDSLIILNDGQAITTSPPTCEECIPLALELCPALKRAHVILKVLEYRVWGVQGSVVGVKDGRAFETRGRIEYDRDYSFPMATVLARQQVVELTKFVKEKP